MKNFLLTWHDTNGYEHFGWFESEEELRDFVASNDIQVVDAIEIYNNRDIILR